MSSSGSPCTVPFTLHLRGHVPATHPSSEPLPTFFDCTLDGPGVALPKGSSVYLAELMIQGTRYSLGSVICGIDVVSTTAASPLRSMRNKFVVSLGDFQTNRTVVRNTFPAGFIGLLNTGTLKTVTISLETYDDATATFKSPLLHPSHENLHPEPLDKDSNGNENFVYAVGFEMVLTIVPPPGSA
eukprot:tig00000492_g1551.t1